jgi:hypothetical protein
MSSSEQDVMAELDKATVVWTHPTLRSLSRHDALIILHALIEQKIYAAYSVFDLQIAERISAKMVLQSEKENIEFEEWSGGWACMRDALRANRSRALRLTNDPDLLFDEDEYKHLDEILWVFQQEATASESQTAIKPA